MMGLRAGVFACLVTLLLVACSSVPKPGSRNMAAANANAKLGVDYLQKGELDKAATTLKRALRYDPDQVDANWGLAIIARRRQKPDKADQFFRKALDKDAKPAILNSYAAFLCNRGQTQKAVSMFLRAANDPRYKTPGNALSNAGLCLQRAKNYTAAARMYKQALKTAGEQPSILKHLAKIESALGHDESAQMYTRRYNASGQDGSRPSSQSMAVPHGGSAPDRDTTDNTRQSATTPSTQPTRPSADNALDVQPKQMVATTTINVRTGQGTSNPAIGQLHKGDIVTVVDDPGGKWMRMRSVHFIGWVYKPLFRARTK